MGEASAPLSIADRVESPALLEVFDDVFCQEFQTARRVDDGFQLRPLGLQAFLALDFFALGDYLEGFIYLRLLVFRQVEFG